jgi:alpha-galactosidase
VFGFSREECGWGGWQYFDPDENDGFLMAFRRKESLSDTVNIRLKGLNDDTVYEFTDADSGEVWEMSGKDAKLDFKIVIKERVVSRLIRYRKK